MQEQEENKADNKEEAPKAKLDEINPDFSKAIIPEELVQQM